MDLQVILDSTDGDSSSCDSDHNGRSTGVASSLSPYSSSRQNLSVGNCSSKSNPPNFHGTGLGTPVDRGKISFNGFGGSTESEEVDLEQILREDDDDVEMDDDDAENVDDEMEDYEDWSGRYGTVPRTYGSIPSLYPPPSSRTEDWDVLQAILGEDDDEDGVDANYHALVDDDPVLVRHSTSPYTSRKYGRGNTKIGSIHYSTSFDLVRNRKVDIILQQSDDQDDAMDHSFRSMSNESFTSPETKASNDAAPCPLDIQVTSLVTTLKSEELENFNSLRFESRKDESLSKSIPGRHQYESNVKATESSSSEFRQAQSDRVACKKEKGNAQVAKSDADFDEASRNALQVATAQERKLLKSGHRDIVSPLMVKRRLRPKIELDSRQQKLQKDREHLKSQEDSLQTKLSIRNTVATASHLANTVKFNFAGGIIHTKNMSSISKHLHDRCRSNQDLPTAVGINSRFIAVGTQKGIILVFDLFEVLRQKLGGEPSSAGADETNYNHKTAGSVTTIDLSLIHGEFLAAGYTSGIIVLWDTIKGAALKSIVEPNLPSPMVSVRFLSDLKLVSVDASGLVNKLNFQRNLLWTSYSVESECLLDGTAGQILAMNVLPPYQYVKQQLPHDCPAIMKRLVLLALSSERSSFAVAVEPKVHVLHRWAKPEVERIVGSNTITSAPPCSQVFLPCLSWGWALVNGGSNIISPILARAWGCCIQLLRAVFPDTDDDGHQPETFQWPAFGVHDEFDTNVPVVAVEWLNERSLVYLSTRNEFSVADTVMMTLQERLDFSGLNLVFAEFSLSRKVVVNNDHPDGPEIYYCTTFQNSFRACDNRLLLLCQEDMKNVSIVGARPRVSALENDGEWLEALALALDHYESTIKSQEDRRRDPSGRRDLSKHPGFRSDNGRSEDEEWIAKLLIRYVNIAVENAPEINSSDFQPDIMRAQMELAKSHFQMLAGVCVEFCLVTKRLDLLFGPIFRRFHAAGFLTIFLDVLEPYILNDKLDYIAPEAMMHFIEHCRTNNEITTVERCLLHMDVTIMDFDSILTLLRSNEMYSALFYVYNQGLDDFTTPLEILLEKIFDSADTVGLLTNERRIDGVPKNDFEKYGYKAILYLQSCLSGKTFPLGNPLPQDKFNSVRSHLLRYMLQRGYNPSKTVSKEKNPIGERALRYPYAHILLMVDPKALLKTFSIAMHSDSAEFVCRHAPVESIGGWEVEVGANFDSENINSVPDRQEIISMLLSIMMPSQTDVAVTRQTTLYQSKTAVNAFLDFLADYLMKGVVKADSEVTFMILQRSAIRLEEARDPQERQHWQAQIISLLTAIPRSAYDTDRILDLVEKSGIHRASLILHQQEASSWSSGDSDWNRRAEHFRAAIDCYLDDDSPEFRNEVYGYIKKECSGASDERKPHALINALLSKLTDLVLLNPLMSAELAADLFVDDPDHVIQNLNDEEAKYMFLRAIIAGDSNGLDSVAVSVLNAQLTMEHHHQYLGLMAKIHPELVYDYLSSHDNYRPEECLKLCQEYDIADASAYLLERMGNVTSALQLILQTMESRLMNLKRTIRGLGTDYFKKYHSRRFSKYDRNMQRANLDEELFDKQEKEIEGLKRILVVALDVCERNSGAHSSVCETQHGSQLWFNVLDRLINAKGFLRLSKEQPAHAKIMAGVLSELLHLTMQRMVSSVPLPDLVRKVTTDHSGSRLGELREMIESLLTTYGLELDVFGRAVSVFRFDDREMEKAHHALRIKGLNVQAVMSIENSSTQAMQEVRSDHRVLLLGSEVSRNANVVIWSSNQCQLGRKHEMGLGDALHRLRSRRVTASAEFSRSFAPNKKVRSASLNLMTTVEQTYCEGQTSSDVTFFEERQVGQLGDAEHKGRIMSFMY